MNDTGGGVTAIHDVPGDITRIGFHWMLLFFPFSHSKGASICSSHGVSRRSRGFFVPNLRIIELFPSHGESRRSRIFLSRFFSLSRIFEFSNFFFTRRIAEITDFLCPDFFPCPEFANLRIFSSHGESRNNLFYHELSNYRISFTRNVAEVTDFLLSRDLSLDPLTNGR